MRDKEVLLRTENLSYRYPKTQRLFTFPDVCCSSGESLLVKGPSGCGKSTWLHLIAGLLKPEDGQIYIHQTPVHLLENKGRDQFRARHIGLVLQKAHFIESLNVLENLQLFQQLSTGKHQPPLLHDLLEALDLLHLANQKTKALSQGEAQRLSVARALVNRPLILLADEPTASLDDQRALQTIHLLLDQAKNFNTSLVVVSHDSRLEHLLDHKVQLS